MKQYFVILIIILIQSCTGGDNGSDSADPAPSIASFNAVDSIITLGESTTLTSVFTNGTGIIGDGVGLVDSGVGVIVAPVDTTTYILTVTNSSGVSVSSQTTITVVPAPSISSFSVADSSITLGGSTALTGVFANGTGSIDNGIGVVTSGVSIPVTPIITTQYILTVTNDAGSSVGAQVTISVTPLPPIPSISSFGSINGFGSVFVNGVEFETDSSTFDVDGASGTQNDLAIGMIVQVSGTINDDGVTGTATNVSFDDELQGPVTGLTSPDADGLTRSFIVLGTNIIIDSGSTSFDVSNDVTLPANTTFDFDSIADNNNVEVSGFFDSNGNLKATRAELKDITFDTNSIVEIKGVISGLNGTTFTIGSLTVDASSATLENLPNGLEVGLFVEVKGTLNAGLTTLMASKVGAKDNSVNDTNKFELEGIITDYVDDSNFRVNGISVGASSAIREPASLSLSNDIRIEAEGAIVNGMLVANVINLESGTIKIHAVVTSVDVVDNTFTVTPVTGQPQITVTVTTGTQLEDGVNDIAPFTLNDFVVNDFVEVRGFDDGNGGITANEVDVKDPDDVVVQGVIQTGSSEASNIIKVLGVEFTIDYPSETSFEDENEVTMTATEFFDAVSLDSTLIKVKDVDKDGIADEIDIEIPK